MPAAACVSASRTGIGRIDTIYSSLDRVKTIRVLSLNYISAHAAHRSYVYASLSYEHVLDAVVAQSGGETNNLFLSL